MIANIKIFHPRIAPFERPEIERDNEGIGGNNVMIGLDLPRRDSQRSHRVQDEFSSSHDAILGAGRPRLNGKYRGMCPCRNTSRTAKGKCMPRVSRLRDQELR
jgi:hypothetical protein